LSRASSSELEKRLEEFGSDRVDARLITLRRLDYGITLDGLGRDLISRWTSDTKPSNPLLLLMIETQNKRAAVLADETLQPQLPETLLTSTGRTTMAIPLREGDRYRQASIDGLTRLSVVLNGGEDPGPPEEIVRTTLPTNIPTQEETESSNATTWIVVLLVLGTIIPMATWWVFSR
ncbi:MAG: TPM domain-containing protein, partial [Cyanobacteriota bacterium]|nr:TPM domain-containing protein [Cyanobacteriota bacterium]